jgi:hypothetical protein
MKKTIFSLIWVLLATVTSGKAETTSAFETTQQSTVFTTNDERASLPPSSIEDGNTQKPIKETDPKPAKSKHKRQIGLKIFGSVVVAYGILMLLSVIFGPLFPYK